MAATGRLKRKRKKPIPPPSLPLPNDEDMGEPLEALKVVSEQAKSMTPAEFRESLVSAGIITPDGKLTENYATPPRKKRTVRK